MKPDLGLHSQLFDPAVAYLSPLTRTASTFLFLSLIFFHSSYYLTSSQSSMRLRNVRTFSDLPTPHPPQQYTHTPVHQSDPH